MWLGCIGYGEGEPNFRFEVVDDGCASTVELTEKRNDRTQGSIAGRDVIEPLVLGHETAGEVHAIAPGDEEKSAPDGGPPFQVGDRVVIKPAIPCGKCRQCRRGFENRCEDEAYFALPPTHGAMCQYFLARHDGLLRVPKGTTWKAAGCVQPLAIGVQIARRAQFKPFQTVAVFGCGPIGQITMSIAKAYGASKVIGIDVDPGRVGWTRNKEHARPDHVFLSKRDKPQWEPLSRPEKLEAGAQDAAQWLAEADLPHGVDVVVEACASEAATVQGLHMLDFGGTYCHVGLGQPLGLFPLLKITSRELTLVGLLRYNVFCFEDALKLLARKQVNLDELVTDNYPLEQAAQACRAVAQRRGIKNVVWSFGERSD